MAEVTYYIALPFIVAADDGIAAGEPTMPNFSDAKVIRSFGDVPNDLSAL
jgi:hypothetical protein